MNKFKGLATRLLNKNKWVNTMTLIEFQSARSFEKKIVKVQKQRIENIPCIRKEVQKFDSAQGVQNKFTAFICSMEGLENTVQNWNNTFHILFNGKEYMVHSLTAQGTINNQATLISFEVVE